MINPKVQIRIENPENILNTKEDGRQFLGKIGLWNKGAEIDSF